MKEVIVFVLVILLGLSMAMGIKMSMENFDMPPGESTGWGPASGPGYGAGYGTGYGLYGIWPKYIPGVPWRYWMWSRGPHPHYAKNETAVPQIDYNHIRI